MGGGFSTLVGGLSTLVGGLSTFGWGSSPPWWGSSPPWGGLSPVSLCPGGSVRRRRQRPGGPPAVAFAEGWVEFRDKRAAKRAAKILHGAPMAPRPRSPFRHHCWSIKVRAGGSWVTQNRFKGGLIPFFGRGLRPLDAPGGVGDTCGVLGDRDPLWMRGWGSPESLFGGPRPWGLCREYLDPFLGVPDVGYYVGNTWIPFWGVPNFGDCVGNTWVPFWGVSDVGCCAGNS